MISPSKSETKSVLSVARDVRLILRIIVSFVSRLTLLDKSSLLFPWPDGDTDVHSDDVSSSSPHSTVHCIVTCIVGVRVAQDHVLRS